MLCVFNIHKLIVLFSSLCVEFGLWCEYFAGNIVLGAPFGAYLWSRCYNNWVGSSVRILENIFWWKRRYNSIDIVEKKRKLPKFSKAYFSEITTLLKISIVLPATDAVSEGSTSTLRRTKNWVPTSMTQGKLSYCMLLAIYKEMMDRLSLIDVATNEFCFGGDEASWLFRHFCKNYLRFIKV